MKRLSLKLLIMKVALFGFCGVQIQAMESKTSSSNVSCSSMNADTEFLNNNRPHNDINRDAFYTATTLQELIDKQGLEDEIVEYNTREKAAARYEDLNPELKSIMSHFQDSESRTTRAYTHGAILIGRSEGAHV